MNQMSPGKKTNKSEVENKKITIDLTQLSVENDKYLKDVAQFLQEKINDLETVRDGNSLVITVDQNFSRRKIKNHLKKFLYLADLDKKFRPIALMQEEKGYQIHKRIDVE